MLLMNPHREWKWQSLFCAQTSLLLPHHHLANRLAALISPYLHSAAAAPAFGASVEQIQLPRDAVRSRLKNWNELKYFLPLTALCACSGELGGTRREDILRFNLQISRVLSSLVLTLLLNDFFFLRSLKHIVLP